MSNVPAVTMQELELETAELLPSRETLNSCGCHPGGSQVNIIDTFSQSGLLNLAVLSGNQVFL